MKQLKRTIPVLPVRDIDASCKWYEKVLGLSTRYKHEGDRIGERTNYAVLECDGVQVHLILDEPLPYANSWTKAGSGYLYLRVQEVATFHSDILEAGFEITSELEAATWGAMGFELRDPDGNLIRVEQER